MLVKWNNLLPATRRDVQRRFVMWKHDTTSKTFEEWANKKAFYVKKDGALDNRQNHCEPHYLADEA